MMKLRHKKPMNSYVGQANYDSHEFSDEDFQKNAIGAKRAKILKQRIPTEQTRKYAQILASFVQSINTDYENFSNKFSRNMTPIEASLSEIPQSETSKSKSKNVAEDGSGAKITPSAVKQQLNIINQGKGKEVIAVEQQTQKSKKIVKQATNKQAKGRNIAPEELSGNEQRNLKTAPREENNPIAPESSNPQNCQPQLNYDQMSMQNSLYNYNPAFYRSYSPYMSMVYQQIMQQMKHNPNMSMYPLQMYQNQYMHHLLPMGLQNCSIPFSQLSFYDEIKPKTENYKMQSFRYQNPKQPQQSNLSPSSHKQNKLKILSKRSSFHVCIAYSIHYERLRRAGKVADRNWHTEGQNLQKLDPTYPAKNIRQNGGGSYNPFV